VVRDNGELPGGMMRYGIPSYRLPAGRPRRRDRPGRALGVTFEQGRTGSRTSQAEMREGGFDAAFVAVGAHLSKRVDIPNADAGRILDAVSFLRGVEAVTPPPSGRVAVYGGGNTAMDAARVARRMGADDTVIVYRRTREQMPAHESRRRTPRRRASGSTGCAPSASMDDTDLTVEIQELDEHGKPHGTGRFETLEADTVILALGQESDTASRGSMPGVASTATSCRSTR
jgi:formate dehydrogenase beta subunit